MAFDLISIPIHGNLFGLELSDISLLRSLVEKVEVNNTFNLVVCTPTTPSSDSDPAAPSLDIQQDSAAPDTSDATTPTSAGRIGPTSSPEPAPAPCALHTTMVFADARINDFPSLSLGQMQLFVLRNKTVTVTMGHYPPITIDRIQDPALVSAEIRPDGTWSLPARPMRLKPVTEYKHQPVRIPSRRPVSQVRNEEYSATLYRVPLGKDVLLAGQSCRFSETIFNGLFLVALRSHDQGAVYLRKIAIIAVPHPREEHGHAC